MKEPTYIQCDCRTHLIMVDKDPDSPIVYLAFFVHGNSPRPFPFWERLRHIWKILTTGRPYEDQMVLTPNETRKLALALRERAK